LTDRALSAQAAGGYITYDAASPKFSLWEEQAVALIDADLPGAFLLAYSTSKSEPRISEGHPELALPGSGRGARRAGR
jgi:hypothetical protein